VPVAVGAALVWLATTLGIGLDDGTSAAVTAAAVGIVTSVYYAAARAVEARWPAVGRVLLSLGLAHGEPMYVGRPDVPPVKRR
jgi:hypothetical protein